jgi:hypothetical protein
VQIGEACVAMLFGGRQSAAMSPGRTVDRAFDDARGRLKESRPEVNALANEPARLVKGRLLWLARG